LKWKPHEYLDLPDKEKAFVIASIQIKAEDDKKQEDKMKSKSKRR